MHPLLIDLDARMRTAERLERAAARRRVRELLGPRPGVRDRLGSLLVRVGRRLQHHGHRPAVAR